MSQVVDSNLPRFSQAVQAIVLAIAFLLEARFVVAALAVVLLLASAGGPRWNLFTYLYRALPMPRGEPEPAAPPRFAQTLGAIMLTIASAALYAAPRGATTYAVLGWGPALLVAVLAGLAAATTY